MGTPYGSHLHIFAESEAPFAEGEGFKPPIPERGIPDFESSAIDHSANLPVDVKGLSLKSDAKVRTFFEPAKFIRKIISII